MKRHSRRLAHALVLPLGLYLAACGDSLTEVNENPNAPTDVGAQFILPAAIQSAANEALNYGMDLGVTSLWIQHIASLQYGSTDRYNLDPDFSDATWGDFWLDALAETREVVRRAEEAGVPNQQAIGIILRSWIFQNMTDLWGDIPYSQALTADLEDGTVTPVYDTQQDVYTGLFADLEGAVAMLQDGSQSFGAEDLLYQGDVDKWRKFANSIRLRMAMRLSEVDATTAAAEAAAAVNAGVFTSLDDQAVLHYAESAPNQHPYYTGFLERPGDYRVSATIIDTLTALNDPRLPIYAAPIESESVDGVPVEAPYFRGMPNGMPDQHEFGFDEVSKLGDWFLRPNTPSFFLSYAEVLFNQAEAAERNWIGGDAEQFYNDAITASMQFYGIPQAEIDAYLAQPSVAYQGGAAGLEQIALQKWIALFDQGVEAFAEWRRTDVPRLTAGVANVNDDQVPVRIPYPVSESAVNADNLSAARSRQNGATINDPVWWDVN